ncbi:hypothetical protein RND71_011314 [Anisodus tanguticus]|uniref:CCHC-type domain-containing protein n=1 Tax=Anisodus tanguticus TaxID=243964 RepID=A0AAE1VFZ1_9SOLA|nr:hypothetical protein RND71_011314 [Anisodus tanguticus]
MSVNRQGVWSESRKGRVMTCSTCGEPDHNARGCQKVTKGNQTKVGKKTKKRIRSLIDEDDEGVARSPPPVGLTLKEELELTAPGPTQTSQS